MVLKSTPTITVNRRREPVPVAAIADDSRPSGPSRRLLQRLPWSWALKFLVFCAVVVAAALGLGQLRDFVMVAPTFAIRRIDITGTRQLSQDNLLRVAGIAPGVNIFASNVAEIEQRLKSNPWISQVKVQRHVPDRIEIHIRERRAAAMLALGALYLVSDRGLVFKRVTPGDPTDIPVITGISRERFSADLEYRTAVMRDVIGLLHDYDGFRALKRELLSEIHVEPSGDLTLFTGDGPTELRLGRPPYLLKLSRFRRVLDQLKLRNLKPAYVYLDQNSRVDRAVVGLEDLEDVSEI